MRPTCAHLGRGRPTGEQRHARESWAGIRRSRSGGWTDGSDIKELAWFDRGPWTSDERPNGGLAGFWSTYHYNGFIYGSEIQRGLDVFKATGSEFSAADRRRVRTLNAQTQF
jgi:hypothetical protein